MSITTGQNADAADFINESERDAVPANDNGRVPKLEGDAKLSPVFLRDQLASDGSDGDLTITSGTTTIDCGGAQLVVKNYKDISITGTGKLAFSNPHANGTTIILNCWSFTVTSSANPAIDASGMGGAGGVGAISENDGSETITQSVTSGTDAYGFAKLIVKASTSGGGGTRVADFDNYLLSPYSGMFDFLAPGAGARGGEARTFTPSTAVGGDGGRGGAALIVNCTGAWNVTSNISCAGEDGENGTSPSSQSIGKAGGGGGGGCFLGLYGSLVANSGTIDTSGGIGGQNGGGDSTGITTGSGGGAASVRENGTSEIMSYNDGVKTGGDGGDGFSLVTKNTGYL